MNAAKGMGRYEELRPHQTTRRSRDDEPLRLEPGEYRLERTVLIGFPGWKDVVRAARTADE